MKKKRNGTSKVVRPVFLILLFSFLILALVSLGLLKFYQYINNSNRFRIKKIIVYGVEGELRDSVKQLFTSFFIDKNIFFFDKEAIKRRIEMMPEIRSVEIKRRFPDTVVLNIKKETPFALILIGEDLFYVNPYGKLLRIKKTKEYVDLPIITGVNPNMPDFDSILKKAIEIISCFKDMNYKVSELHISRYGSTHIYLSDYRAEILLAYEIRDINQKEIIKKIQRLKKVLKYFKNYAQIKKIFIDLDCLQKGAVVMLENKDG